MVLAQLLMAPTQPTVRMPQHMSTPLLDEENTSATNTTANQVLIIPMNTFICQCPYKKPLQLQ